MSESLSVSWVASHRCKMACRDLNVLEAPQFHERATEFQDFNMSNTRRSALKRSRV